MNGVFCKRCGVGKISKHYRGGPWVCAMSALVFFTISLYFSPLDSPIKDSSSKSLDFSKISSFCSCFSKTSRAGIVIRFRVQWLSRVSLQIREAGSRERQGGELSGDTP